MKYLFILLIATSTLADTLPQHGLNLPMRIARKPGIQTFGDMNLNEISGEIQDFELFVNYFLHGLDAFTINLAGQTAISDINADGKPLTVADLVYFKRVIIGEALPYPRSSGFSAEHDTTTASLSLNDYTLQINDSVMIGGVYILAGGNAMPRLLVDDFQMQKHYDGLYTRIIIYSFEENTSFTGPFLEISAPIISIEMATETGNPVKIDRIP